MKLLLITSILTLVPISYTLSQDDSVKIIRRDTIVTYRNYQLERALSCEMLPGFDLGATYSKYFGNFGINIGALGFIQNRGAEEDLLVSNTLPYSHTDTSIHYRKSELYYTQCEFSLGGEYSFAKFDMSGRMFYLKGGVDLLYGRYNVFNTNGEYYYNYVTDNVTDQHLYYDENNELTADITEAQSERLIDGSAEWNYEYFGVHPFLALQFVAKKVPLGLGFRWIYRLNHYMIDNKKAEDPLNIAGDQPESFSKNYLTFRIVFSAYF